MAKYHRTPHQEKEVPSYSGTTKFDFVLDKESKNHILIMAKDHRSPHQEREVPSYSGTNEVLVDRPILQPPRSPLIRKCHFYLIIVHSAHIIIFVIIITIMFTRPKALQAGSWRQDTVQGVTFRNHVWRNTIDLKVQF